MTETPRDREDDPYAEGYEGDGREETGADPIPTPDDTRLASDDATPANAGGQEATRASVVREAPPSDGEGDEDEYRWHTGMNRPTGVPDAVEFVDVHKAFGRNKILRGLN